MVTALACVVGTMGVVGMGVVAGGVVRVLVPRVSIHGGHAAKIVVGRDGMGYAVRGDGVGVRVELGSEVVRREVVWRYVVR